MREIEWEQRDLDVLVKENNESTIVWLNELDKPSDSVINIELRDGGDKVYGKLELNSAVNLELVKKAITLLKYECEIKKCCKDIDKNIMNNKNKLKGE